MTRTGRADLARNGRLFFFGIALASLALGVPRSADAAGSLEINATFLSSRAEAERLTFGPPSESGFRAQLASFRDLDQLDFREIDGPTRDQLEARREGLAGAAEAHATADVFLDAGPLSIVFSTDFTGQGGASAPTSLARIAESCCLGYPDEITSTEARAAFSTAFQVSESTPFSMAFGDIGRSRSQSGSVSDQAFVRLVRNDLAAGPFSSLSPNAGTEILLETASDLDADFAITTQVSGVLEPGWWYWLEVRDSLEVEPNRLNRTNSAARSFEFQFVVPEPGTALLMGLGLMGLGARRGGRGAA